MSNKIALVTGASSGIGAEIARKLAAKGVYVFLNYSRDDKKAQSIADEIIAAGGVLKL